MTPRTTRPTPLVLLCFWLLGCAPEEVVLPSPFLPGRAPVVTQPARFGSHRGKGVWAIDFQAPVGTPLVAVVTGRLIRVKQDSTRGGCHASFAQQGNHVVLRPDHGAYDVLYLHLAAHSVPFVQGAGVTKGQVIGQVGQSGWVCQGAHLHLQVQRQCGQWWCDSRPYRIVLDQGRQQHGGEST